MDITFDIIGALDDAASAFHVNTIPAVPGWEAYQVFPAEKHRVFAGMAEQTICYRFPDEQTFAPLHAALTAGEGA